MCDLLGFSFNRPVNAKISLDVFQQAGHENPDGWGVAAYPRNLLHIYKEPCPAFDSKLYDFVESHVESSVFISHVRRSTRGVKNYFNTHPFYRALSFASTTLEIALAHNGTLNNFESLKTGRHHPIGNTDSEHLLCHLLSFIDDLKPKGWSSKLFSQIEAHLREVNEDSGTMNLLFSDGTYMFCYSDLNGHNGGLRYTERRYPFGVVKLARRDRALGSVQISMNLDETKSRDTVGIIVSTEDLTDEPWQPVGAGHLMVVKDGEIVFYNK